MSESIKVGISDYKITQAPNELVTIGLGSCVGIALYAPKSKVGALSHIMLPDSHSFSDKSNWAKFADLALPNIAKQVMENSNETRLLAKIAGGASMFSFSEQTSSLQIGKRNIQAVTDVLNNLNIPIVSEHVGGNMGRSMFVDLNTFDVRVRMVNREEFIV